MRYNKQSTDITTQLAMLKQRGLIVSDEDTALKQLASISYFRLASYWIILPCPRCQDDCRLYGLIRSTWASLMDGRMSRYGNNFISHFFVFC
ncbi:MAG: hypothetical protein J5965_28865 [Aeriscardovia sp.]|nr:hypothetical protein [Aeriscardovia sp.]